MRELADIGFAAEPARHRRASRSWWRTEARARGRTCCSTATTTCSRLIRWSSGTGRRSSRASPTRRGGKAIFGRGASDDKGQVMTFLEAVRAWKAVTGRIPGRLTVLLEGEEESGSPSLAPFLEANAASSAPRWRWSATPACSGPRRRRSPRMLRGIVGEELTIRGADRDLHSGVYGGPAINPDPGAGAHPRRAARRRGADHAAGLLRRGGGAAGDDPERSGRRSTTTRAGSSAAVGLGRLAGEERAVGARAGLVAAELRHQRHLGRLHRGGVQDGAAGGGARQGQLPAGRASRIRRRSSRASGPTSGRACRRTARSASAARRGRGR